MSTDQINYLVLRYGSGGSYCNMFAFEPTQMRALSSCLLGLDIFVIFCLKLNQLTFENKKGKIVTWFNKEPKLSRR